MSRLPPKIFPFKLTNMEKRLVVLQGHNKPLSNLKHSFKTCGKRSEHFLFDVIKLRCSQITLL